jgi:hypothetical protein
MSVMFLIYLCAVLGAKGSVCHRDNLNSVSCGLAGNQVLCCAVPKTRISLTVMRELGVGTKNKTSVLSCSCADPGRGFDDIPCINCTSTYYPQTPDEQCPYPKNSSCILLGGKPHPVSAMCCDLADTPSGTVEDCKCGNGNMTQPCRNCTTALIDLNGHSPPYKGPPIQSGDATFLCMRENLSRHDCQVQSGSLLCCSRPNARLFTQAASSGLLEAPSLPRPPLEITSCSCTMKNDSKKSDIPCVDCTGAYLPRVCLREGEIKYLKKEARRVQLY